MNIKFFHLALTFLLLLGVGSTKALAVSSNTTMQHQTSQGEDDDEDESQTNQGEDDDDSSIPIGIRIDDTIIKNTGEVTAPWLKSGSVYYDAENKTLTLDNAIIEDEYYDTDIYFMASNVPGLQIITKGTSSISSTRRKLMVFTRSVTFLGGTLTLKSRDFTLFAYCNGWDLLDVVFKDCALKAASEIESTITGDPCAAIKFINTSADISFSSGLYGIVDFDAINFEGCALTPPKNYTIKKDRKFCGEGDTYYEDYRVQTKSPQLTIRPLSSIEKGNSTVSKKGGKKISPKK